MQPEPSSTRLWLQAMESVNAIQHSASLTFGEVLNDLSDRFGEHTALIDSELTLSFSGMAKLANRYANWCRTQPVQPGDVIALFMHNCAEYLPIWAGLTQAGYVVALINTNLTHDALAHAISVSDAKLIIIGAELEAGIRPLLGRFPNLICVGHGDSLSFWPRVDVAINAVDDIPPPRAVSSPHETALLIYTSGTTGFPKAARVSHARILRWSYWFAGLMNTRPTDRLYNCLPMYHSTGGVSSIGALLVNGGSVYIRRRFSAQKFWPEIIESRATIFQYIGELCRYLLNADTHPLERSHFLRLCCGNGLRKEVWHNFENRFQIPRILEFYAMTEGAVSLYNCEGRAGSVGRIPRFLEHRASIALVRTDTHSNTPVRGVDGNCIACGTDEPGEAIGRLEPGNRFDGYTDNTQSESKIIRNVFETGDMWYRTGDLMHRDKDGFYYFNDRLGDSFRWKGENISANEVANVISLSPSVVDSVVYGVRIPGHEGQAGMAAIVRAAGFSLTELHEHVHSQLPAYARPIFLRICASISRTGTFKLAGGSIAKEGIENTRLEDIWFDNRETHSYIPLTRDILSAIQKGEMRI